MTLVIMPQNKISDAFHAAWKEEETEENEDTRYDPREEHFDQRDYLLPI
ncbi:hypothetical protein B488_09040 [Liberibacter crescens BT-1]|uniref:Uncharacterized protein n=1 Tax=Liberibacter crescens (strain BT-1) TaxID=1215343 RepID=L0EWZ2_LIBCB|nr:hypothetical protein [Liberibacter crescens]AGA64896.1 hypothetical protein B488_09040 [Liberibacter crescens BT-1]